MTSISLPSGNISEAMVEARELLNAFSIYTVEDDDGVRLSTGGHTIAHYGEHTPQGIALLKLDAHCRALTAALSVPAPGTGGAELVAQLGAGSEHDLHNVLKSVLHHFGPEGAQKVTADALAMRPTKKDD